MPPDRSIPAALVRQIRETFGLSSRDVARVFRIGKSSVYRFEETGAPPWMLLALGGLGLIQFGRGVAEMTTLLGIDPDAEPPRSPDGSYGPVVPTTLPLELEAGPARESEQR